MYLFFKDMNKYIITGVFAGFLWVDIFHHEKTMPHIHLEYDTARVQDIGTWSLSGSASALTTSTIQMSQTVSPGSTLKYQPK